MKLILFALVLAACVGPTPSADRGGAHLQVDGVAVAFREPQVLSVAADDHQFAVTLLADFPPDGDQAHTVTLAAAEREFVANGWGRNGDVGTFVFRVDAAQAHAVAAALGVSARLRAPWRATLQAGIELAAEWRAGAAQLPLRLRLTNTGPVPVWFLNGGRGRNELGRDNRCSFAIECDGEPLPTRAVIDFGGLGQWWRLEPGASATLAIDLAHWCTLDRVGTYALHASYQADLMPAEFEPGAALPMGWYAHLQRTCVVTAELAFELR